MSCHYKIQREVHWVADLKFNIWQFFEMAVSEKLKFEKKLYNATAVLEKTSVGFKDKETREIIENVGF